MNKPFLRAAAAMALSLALCGCAPEYTPQPTTTYPTLPSFPQEQTPLEQLRGAMSAAWSQETYTITWGQVRSDQASGGTERSQTVTAQTPADWQAVFAEVPLLKLQQNFPEDFCSRPLRAIPSNTGIIRYQLTGLSREDAVQLLYGGDCAAEFDSCEIAIEIMEGLFTRLEIQFFAGDTASTVYLSFDYPDSE